MNYTREESYERSLYRMTCFLSITLLVHAVEFENIRRGNLISRSHTLTKHNIRRDE